MNEDKIQILCDENGYNSAEQLAEDYMNDGVVPGICMNDDCDFTAEYEPDQDKGWCEICETNSVFSLYVLMGII